MNQIALLKESHDSLRKHITFPNAKEPIDIGPFDLFKGVTLDIGYYPYILFQFCVTLLKVHKVFQSYVERLCIGYYTPKCVI